MKIKVFWAVWGLLVAILVVAFFWPRNMSPDLKTLATHVSVVPSYVALGVSVLLIMSMQILKDLHVSEVFRYIWKGLLAMGLGTFIVGYSLFGVYYMNPEPILVINMLWASGCFWFAAAVAVLTFIDARKIVKEQKTKQE